MRKIAVSLVLAVMLTGCLHTSSYGCLMIDSEGNEETFIIPKEGYESEKFVSFIDTNEHSKKEITEGKINLEEESLDFNSTGKNINVTERVINSEKEPGVVAVGCSSL